MHIQVKIKIFIGFIRNEILSVWLHCGLFYNSMFDERRFFSCHSGQDKYEPKLKTKRKIKVIL